MLRELLRSKRGQGTTEYIIIAAAIALAALIVVTTILPQIQNKANAAASAIEATPAYE